MPKKGIAYLINNVTQEALLAFRRQRPLVSAAHLSSRLMDARTNEGIDRFGRSFVPYSKSYARKKGRRAPVTLRDTGVATLAARTNMVAAGDIRSRRIVEIQPRDPETRYLWEVHSQGHAVHGDPYIPQRDFIGLTPQEEERVARHVKVKLRQALPKPLRRRVRITVINS